MFIKDFLELFYPPVCQVCSRLLVTGEHLICSHCYYEIPRTYFHRQKDNALEQVFWGRVRVEKAAAFFYYTHGSRYRKLIHQLKYSGNIDIGVLLGKYFAGDLEHDHWFDDIDLLIPVPLHKKRLRKRGYNQSEIICRGISEISKKPVNTTAFIRSAASETQTKKSRFDRWTNVETLFAVQQSGEIENKHILLIDDVITTGATLEACLQVLLNVKGVKVSVASLGFAQ